MSDDRSQSPNDDSNLTTTLLRREAAQSAPEFSQELHARVMHAVSQAQRATLSRFPARSMAGLTALVAAAIAIAIGIAIVAMNRRVVEQTSPRMDDHLASIIPPLPEEPLRAVRAQLEEQRLAYLDRDARQLANFVVEQLSNTIPSTADDRAPMP